MSFKLKVRKAGSTPVLMIAGDITGNNIGKITSKLENIRRIFSGKIAIDLSQTTFIDSHGLGVFVFFFRRFSEENRQLLFLKPSDFIMDLFSGSNLNKIFTIIDNEENL
ncbi:MAG: STAS domain-containing protein [Chitinispirillaceae bacterium]|nr:STAS domain-containing protein [Chitinispirillaceae bacterium]